tara:strand:+ start:46476 stop:47198 length:723 start_codon:yes stop_codon:yes gene_type:complete
MSYLLILILLVVIGWIFFREKSKVVETNLMQRPQPANGDIRHPLFFIDGHKLSPYKFGELVVKLSIKSSTQTIKELLSSAQEIGYASDDCIYARIAMRPRLAQLLVMASHIAVYYVFAQLILRQPRSIMSEMYQGIVDDISKWLPDSEMMEHFELQMRTYSEMLFADLQVGRNDLGFNTNGPIAHAVVDLLGVSYSTFDDFKDRSALILSPLECYLIGTHIDASLKGLLDALQKMKVSVS